MVRYSKEDYEATKFLGGVVGAKFPKLRAMAMIAPEERELLGLSECLKIILKQEKLIEKLDGQDEITLKELEHFVKKIIDPILVAYGESRYKMSEISHLSMKIGSQKRRLQADFPIKF